MTALYDIVKAVRAEQDGGATSIQAVYTVLDTLEADKVRDLAMITLLDEIHRLDRLAALEIERRAEEPVPVPPQPPVATGKKAAKTKWTAADLAAFDATEKKYMAKLKSIVADYTQEIRMEWTQELLASTFALPDGTLVSWGAATLEQHVQRRDMFAQNAHANLEGAARHEHAIRELTQAQAACLGDLVKAVA